MKIKITLSKSLIGHPEEQRKMVAALGLRKVGASVVHEDTPSILGTVRKCAHLLTVEQIAE